jgi:alkylhydroperoxidase family enzyme
MLRYVISKRLDSAERELGASVDYLRHILRVSVKSFFKFAKVLSMANCRRQLPMNAFHVGLLVATRDEDCGTCVQIGVNMAKKDGVPNEVLRAVVEKRPDDLPDDLADVYRFAEAVVTANGQDGPWRDRILERFGEQGLVDLAIGMAACRVFPITKRAMGYAKSCSQVHIEI